MFRLLSVICLVMILIYRKFTSRTVLTPSGILASTWLVFLVFQMILAPKILFSLKTYIFIMLFILAFTFGEHCHILFFWKRTANKKLDYPCRDIRGSHSDRKMELALRISVISIGLISLLGSLMYADAIARYFGSYREMLSAGWAVRGALAEGQIYIPRIVRGLSTIGYSSIVLAIVYWIKYRFRLFLTIPVISMLIFGVAQNGRAGMILIIVQIFLGAYWRDAYNNKGNLDFRLIKRMTVPFIFIFVIFTVGLMLREQNFYLDNSTIRRYLNVFVIYAFGGIGALTSYLNNPVPNTLGFGRFSFASLFDLLGIHKNVMGIYTDYLPISDVPGEVSNIYTVIRPALDDFGILGFVVFFFIVGFICSLGYKKAKKGSIMAISFTIVSYSYIIHSPLLPMTVHNSFLASMILPQLVLYFLEIVTIEKRNYNRQVFSQRGKRK